MRSEDKKRLTVLLEEPNFFMKSVRGAGYLINYLLIKEFGSDVGDTEEEKRELLLQKVTKALDLIESEARDVIKELD